MLRICDPICAKRRLQTVTFGPNLVGGDPEGLIWMLRCIRAWGGAPFPNVPRNPNQPPKKSAKSHSGPLQPRPTHTPSRRCAPCSLACFHFFFRELPLLTRPHLTQPLLLTFETAEKERFFIAVQRQRCRCAARHLHNQPSALNNRVAVVLRLVPGSIPAHADRCSKKSLWSAPRPYLYLS